MPLYMGSVRSPEKTKLQLSVSGIDEKISVVSREPRVFLDHVNDSSFRVVDPAGIPMH